MKNLSDLTIGTVIEYNDISNVNLQYVVLDSTKDNFGSWVNVLNKETNKIGQMASSTQIGLKWVIVS